MIFAITLPVDACLAQEESEKTIKSGQTASRQLMTCDTPAFVFTANAGFGEMNRL
ncbi:MAG: hypothetical protein U0989_10900 [Azonexus sp.]|nr:hypothetical protein [Azonexus sp.]MDP3637637.1 hypothetical protein [Azonexus sp.]MDZ4315256.1 hypothetical protein [Azonexus sp.]